jgi:hypothetical protein
VFGGETAINFLANRDAPTQYFLYGSFVPSRFTQGMAREFYEDIVSRPPALILGNPSATGLPPLYVRDPVAWVTERDIYAQPYLDEFFQFVHENYRYEAYVGKWQVYALRH